MGEGRELRSRPDRSAQAVATGVGLLFEHALCNQATNQSLGDSLLHAKHLSYIVYALRGVRNLHQESLEFLQGWSVGSGDYSI